MSKATVKQLSDIVGVPVERLIEQLHDAGIKAENADSSISDEDKIKLLESLRKHHNKDKDGPEPKKITLRRKTTSEIKVTSSAGAGRSTTKTVQVQVKKKRTYIKRSDLEQEKESELEALAKQKAERAAEQEQADAALAAKRQAREEQEKKQAKEDEAKKAARDEAARKELEAAESEAKKAAEEAKAATEQANAQKEAEKKSKHKKGKSAPDTRYGRKELHVSKGQRGKRSGKTKRHLPKTVSVDGKHGFERPVEAVVKDVQIAETISVADLAKKMAIKSSDVIKSLMGMGVMATINQILDQDTAILVIEDLGHNPVVYEEVNLETEVLKTQDDDGREQLARAPVVTIMGHVDHGKTSLLDYIRRTKVTDGEAGGITQHIGAYSVQTNNGAITFLDTPGHAAFSAMRARGAQVTDIVILVVAADDGVMPQTKEAVEHAKAAGVTLIVAVNKIDKEDADPERVKNELSALQVIPEDWGGEHMFVNVSALTGDGVPELLDAISLQAEVLELKAPNTGGAAGIVVEASLDKGRGPVATILVSGGILKKGDILLAGSHYGRVRAMFDESGQAVKEAGPSTPVVVLGLSSTPGAGDDVLVVESERKAREIANMRHERAREGVLSQQHAAKLENMFDLMTEGDVGYLTVLIKSDVQGSAEALRDALDKLSTDEVKVKIVSSGVGGINESDVNLAAASQSIIMGFNVRADSTAKRGATEQGVEIRYYSVIYDLIDDVKAAMGGMLSPEVSEKFLGLAEVRDVFKSPKFGSIAGSIVTEGSVRRDLPIRVLRDNVVIYEGELESLRRYKDDVNEVKMGTECGIGVKNYKDVRPGDQIEVFERVETARTID